MTCRHCGRKRGHQPNCTRPVVAKPAVLHSEHYRKPANELTDRQREIYRYIVANMQTAGPTIRDIAAHFAIESPNGVECHLLALEAKGFIKRIGQAHNRKITLPLLRCPRCLGSGVQQAHAK